MHMGVWGGQLAGRGAWACLEAASAFRGDLEFSWTPKLQQRDLCEPGTWARRWPDGSQPGHGSLTPGQSAVRTVFSVSPEFLPVTVPAGSHSASWSHKASVCSALSTALPQLASVACPLRPSPGECPSLGTIPHDEGFREPSGTVPGGSSDFPSTARRIWNLLVFLHINCCF